MKKAALLVLVMVQFMAGAGCGALLAQPAGSSPDAVMCLTNRTLLQHGPALTLVTETMTMPGGIKVFTNGTFQVNGGKIRTLREGQFLRNDGFMLNPDRSLVPVIDHIAMSGAQVVVYKDGDATPITEPIALPDGTSINPDGSYLRGTRSARLVDGQMITLDGASLGGLDSINFVNGQVTVYKNGIVMPIQSGNVIMGMYDGTRVRGDGQITYPDGTTAQMTDGQMLTVPGVRASW